ncbi:MAG: photosystem II protein PsbQ [Geminocystis sp.]|nr:photosystem II protein PsbQ [Geminocystis sp.]HIK37665.1 photosystem II protein PsbQ [Geminocystis sp. M7585_C2015_104]MCS7148779.1 photosystem II protein PsbQ [Geminocystis sp.]MCX8078681.1 photosystem II protein PsbQ [Geminocystis sp.]MDW8115383.1 photosystem II protein PsbQ [Geminocystis sp.]
MRLLRPIFCLTLVLVTTMLVSCSSPAKAKIPTSYTPERIAQIQEYREPIVKAREQMSTLEKLIQEENWMDVRTFIHGPLGELRQNMAITSRKLLPKDQKPAQEIAKSLFVHFEKLDLAAKERNLEVAKNEFREAIKDFDAYLQIVPSNG